MALTLHPVTAAARPGRLRRTATGPVPVLLAASALATGFLLVVADVVAKLG
jgi:hypothetical protein